LDGGPAAKTGARPAIQTQGFGAPPPLAAEWLADGNRIVFTGRMGDSTNLWQFSIDPATWQITGPAQRLTSGAGLEVHPSAAAHVALSKRASGDRIAFASLVENLNIWSLPINANQARVSGEVQPLTREASGDYLPAVSADGAA